MTAENREIPEIITTDMGPFITVDEPDDGENNNPNNSHVPELRVDRPATPTSDDGDDPFMPSHSHSLSTPMASTSAAGPHHQRSPSDPNFLTPILKLSPVHRPSASLEVPGSSPSPSPYSPSIGSENSWIYPPSPTLSTRSSVHFQQPTTLALRENNPDAKSGMDSLQLLGSGSGPRHHRKMSSASATSVSFVDSAEGSTSTDPDPHAKSPITDRSEAETSPTMTHVGSEFQGSESGKSATSTAKALKEKAKRRKKRKDKDGEKDGEADEEEEPREHLDPSKDTSDPSPFTLKPLHLASLVDPKSLEELRKIGGPEGILRALGTDPKTGLSARSLGEAGDAPSPTSDDDDKSAPNSELFSIEDRKRVYGTNVVPTRKGKSLLLLMWLAFKDQILIMLSIAAVVSLALGLFQDFGTPPEYVTCPDGTSGCTLPRVDWVEGVAIIIAIIIVDVVGSVNDWQKERQFRKLNEKKEDRSIKVIRSQKETVINIKDVLVGDIAILEPGEIIPCDGIFLRGHNVKCDESGATGESDAISKIPYEKCLEHEEGEDGTKSDCFLISGSKVQEGIGEYVIIAIGTRSFHGRIMMSLRTDAEETPLQSKLNYVAELIAKLGTLAGLILFSALMIRFFVSLKTESHRSGSDKAIAFVNNLVISFTLVVVAVPEGLPLAVTLALAFATKRMTKENLLVRVLASCETMANASVVCTDKTGTLTQNEMSVVAGSLGIHAKFVRRLNDNLKRTNANDKPCDKPDRKHERDFSVDQENLNQTMSEPLRNLFNEAIAANSTAFEDKDPESGQLVFVGSKTETALLTFAKDLGWKHYQKVRDDAQVVRVIPFSSERKASGILIRLSEKRCRLYLKGASELLTKRCTRHIVVQQPGTDSIPANEIATQEIGELTEDNISRTIIFYANQMLRTIALCYRDLDDVDGNIEEVDYEELASQMTLIAIVGIEDPLRLGVTEAVANCHKAGVAVKMCTGDNVLTARSIASQCGIFTAGGIVMEGPFFRTLNEHDMKEVLPRLQVLARSSPEDKKILVDNLKLMGEIVGVTGDGTNDGPALKKANVGFSMGIAGTEVAKEASDIILMDDNFASIVSAIIWGRCVNDAVRKFLQFQISVNITAVIVTFVTAVASNSEQSALTAVQLLWINIIMDTFAALALATDPASLALLDRKPERKNAPLFTVDMVKQIVGQATYQTIVVLIFHFLDTGIWHEGTGGSPLELRHQQLQLSAFIFNAFVWCQIFNSINSRRLDNKLNIFEGITRNWYFIGITLLEIVIQVVVIFVGDAAFQVAPITGTQWGASVAIGFGAIPLGAAIRYIPNEPVMRLMIKLHLMKDPSILPTVDPAGENNWDAAIKLMTKDLSTYSRVRGGRLRGSNLMRRVTSPKAKEVAFPSLMTMVPTIVASSVAGRWIGQGSLSDPAHADPSRSSAALWEGKIQLHPDTAKDDPAYIRWGDVASPVSSP